jgi:hypothetical protein
MFDCDISSGEKPSTHSPFDGSLALNIFIKNSSGKPFEGKYNFVFLERFNVFLLKIKNGTKF